MNPNLQCESERLFDAFEQAWNSPDPPDLEKFTAFVPATLDGKERKRALFELVKIDLEYRWKQSATETASSVIAHSPLKLESYFEPLGLGPISACPIDLIAHEIRVRQWHGELPSIDEYQAQFGALAKRAFAEAAAASETQRSAADQSVGTVDKLAFSDQTSGRPAWSEPLHCPKCHAAIPIDETTLSAELICSSCNTAFVTPGSETATVVPDGSDEAFTHFTAGRPAPDSPADGTGTIRFGDYELLHEIARGGMGVVYKARQIALNRVVALKMIRAGELAGDEEIQRFHAESEAAAKLDHSNIVPVFEVGEQDGLHFFSMGFVEGKGLDARLQDGPLSPREAAELIRTIAEAVQYAHDKGIVHRDLKPANVLIDADGKPRITDFGLAKNIASDSGMTATGQVMGTPSYMPPEQAAAKTGKIGPLTDVYSLGAMLYALLTGRPPFQAANVMETLKQVLEREPVSPRDLNPDVDKDLETICLKCLEKDAGKRYASATLLAEELNRFLTNKPILARPVSRLERGRRWCLRNPLGTALAALVALIAIASPVVTVVQIHLKRQATESAALALENQQKFKSERDRADAKVAELRVSMDTNKSAIDKYVDSVLENELLADAKYQPLRRKMLAHAMSFYAEFIRNHEHNEGSRAAIVDSLERMAFISSRTGFLSKAIPPYQQAIEILTTLVRENPTVAKYQFKLAACYNNLGMVFSDVGKPHDALRMQRQARDIFKRLTNKHPQVALYQSQLAGADHNIAVRLHESGKSTEAITVVRHFLKVQKRLMRDNPSIPSFRKAVGQSLNLLGVLYRAIGKPDEALAVYQQALPIYERLLQENPKVAKYQAALATNLNHVGALYNEINDLGKALKVFQRATQIRRQLANNNPTMTGYQASLATTLGNVAVIQHKTGKPAEALRSHQEALEIYEKLARDNPKVTHYQQGVARTLAKTGVLHEKTGRRSAALSAYEKALDIRKRLASDNPTLPEYQRDLAQTYDDVAAHYHEIGNTAEALQFWQEARMIWERLSKQRPNIPVNQSGLARILHRIGVIFFDMDRPSEALQVWEKSIQLWKPLVRDNPTVAKFKSGFAVSLFSVGVLYSKIGKRDDALQSHHQALQIRQSLVRNYPRVPDYLMESGESLNALGGLYRDFGKSTKAVTAFQQALEVRKQLAQKETAVTGYKSDLAETYRNLGLLYYATGKVGDAQKSIEAAVKLLTRLSNANPTVPAYQETLAASHASLGAIFDRIGDFKKANAAVQRALKIREQLARENRTVQRYQCDLAEQLNSIGLLYARTGHPSEAVTAWQRALTILEQLTKDHPTLTRYQKLLASSLTNIGDHHRATGQLFEALTFYQRALRIREQLAQGNPSVHAHQMDVGNCHSLLGILFRAMGRTDDALLAGQRALKIRERLAKENPGQIRYQSQLADSLSDFGKVLNRTGKTKEAMTAHQRSKTIREQLAREHSTVPQYQSDLASSHFDIGTLHAKNAKRNEALMACRQALKIQERLARDFPEEERYRSALGDTLNRLGLLYGDIGKPMDARKAFQRSLVIRERLAQENQVILIYKIDFSGCAVNFANLVLADKPNESLQFVNKAIVELKQVLERQSGHRTAKLFLRNAYWTRAKTLLKLGRPREATDDWRNAAEQSSGQMRLYFLKMHLWWLTQSDRHVEAAALADTLLKGKIGVRDGYMFARGFAISAQAALRDGQLESTRRKQLAEYYSVRAIGILRALRRTGFLRSQQNQQFFATDPSLNALRHRDDFRKFAKSVGVDSPAWALRPLSTIHRGAKRPVVAPRPRSSFRVRNPVLTRDSGSEK